MQISCLCLGLAQAPQIWILESKGAIRVQNFRNDLTRSPSKTWVSGELDCGEQVLKPTSCTGHWREWWVSQKSSKKWERQFFPCQNQVQSDEERHSLSCTNQFIICVYDLQRKKLWMGFDAGCYLIRWWASPRARGVRSSNNGHQIHSWQITTGDIRETAWWPINWNQLHLERKTLVVSKCGWIFNYYSWIGGTGNWEWDKKLLRVSCLSFLGESPHSFANRWKG